LGEVGKYMLDYEGTLGSFIKFWRKAKKINSKELSNEIGKSDSYISHLENDRYKNPDYETMYKVFKKIGIKEEKIEDYLFHFNIISPDREAWEEERAIIAMQPPTEEDWKHTEDEAEFYNQQEKIEILNQDINRVYKNYTNNSDEFIDDILSENIKSITYILHNMVEHDLSNAYELILGLSKVFDDVSTNGHLYKFMIKFFSHKVTSLDEKGMVKIINTLYEELNRVDREKNTFGKPLQRNFINSL
jgi:transcriptional regulator with XRE-family HTH domain